MTYAEIALVGLFDGETDEDEWMPFADGDDLAGCIVRFGEPARRTGVVAVSLHASAPQRLARPVRGAVTLYLVEGGLEVLAADAPAVTASPGDVIALDDDPRQSWRTLARATRLLILTD